MHFSIVLVFPSLSLAGFAVPDAKRTHSRTNGTLEDVMTIHDDAINLESTFSDSTNDILKEVPAPVSESDGQTLLSLSINNLTTSVIDALTGMVGSKTVFNNAPISRIAALFLQDMKNLQTSADAWVVALNSTLPAILQPQVHDELQFELDSAFGATIKFYL
ncbi:hypothetical protein BD779DRAFT_1671426 [Infundibulicybe gibba]|nr:hypothetical protein BD779DRAFT_1671426 [Infundibulicybe gibba]